FNHDIIKHKGVITIEIFGLLAGLVAIGIIVILFVVAVGLIKWLLQGYFLFRIAEKKNLDVPMLSFVPFGTFYVAGQDFDGHVFQKGSFNPKHLGLTFAITGLIVYFLGLSVGDSATSYILMEPAIFIGGFNAYPKHIVVCERRALVIAVPVRNAAISVQEPQDGKVSKTLHVPVVRTETYQYSADESGYTDDAGQDKNI